MKRLLILGAIWAIAVARPELYKEKEDFQFSRSSTDDGTKSGFYGAQRGNMGGNYERAHNMDSLAQNQMSGLVRHVEGELGDGAKTSTGSVYTAANSGGTYGSANYDLSNLAGRNFKESYDNSQSQSSLSSSAYNSAQYANSRSSTRQSRYQTSANSGLNLQSDDLQSLDHSQGAGRYDYGRQSSQSAGYHSQSGVQQHSAYDNSQTNSNSGYGSNVRTRLVSATPVRIIVRPGTRVAIPVAAQSYDVIHGSALIDQNSLNSEAEVLSNDNTRGVFIPTSNNAKHYESSYNYRKEWEKHDTIPSTVPVSTSTVNPFQYGELYEDSRARATSNQYDASRVDSQRGQASSLYGGYIANVKTSRSSYDAQNQRASSLSNANAYTQAGYSTGSAHQDASVDSSLGYGQTHNAGSMYHGAAVDTNSLTQGGYKAGYNADLNSQVEDINAKPKSYQSSYSYHKSWERQGDPYVIKPASSGYYDGQSSQRLTGSKTGYAASGSHYQHSHQSEADCDENGHIRVARSYNIDQHAQQQSQNIEEFGQQVEDLGQQTQTTWDQDDAGQQSESKWDRLEDLGQQSQNKWDKIEDLGQQTLQTSDKFEDLGQSTLNNFDQKDFGQETQQTSDQLENLGQQTQNDLEQQIQDTEIELGNKLHAVNQQTQDIWDFTNTGQHDQVYEQNQDDHQQHNQFNKQENQSEQSSEKENKNENSPQTNTHTKFYHFESYQSGQENKSKEETNLSSNTFNWHTFFQNVSTNQQPHKPWTNLDTSQLEPHNSAPFWENSTNNFKETHNTRDTIEQSNTGHVSFNSGYFNSQSHINKNQFQKDETNRNLLYSSSHKQDQTINTESSHIHSFERKPSETAPLLSLWNKLDNIEQQSTLVKDLNNGDMKPHHVFQPIQPKMDKELIYTYKKEGIQSVNSEEKERPQDIGRGDIGPEDLSDLVRDNKPSRTAFQTAEPISNEEGQKSNQNKSIEIGKYFVQRENLDSHKSQQQEKIDQQNLQTVGQQNLQEHQKREEQYLADFGHRENLEKQNKQTFEQSQDREHQTLLDFGQHEHLQQENLQVIGPQENLVQNNTQDFKQLDFEQPNLKEPQKKFEQHNLQVPQENFMQQNQQDFGQHENQGQQNLQNLGQQENLEQKNLNDIAQQENLGQKNEQDFEQHQKQEMHNVQDFGQQDNLEQNNMHDFGKHVLDQQNIQDFGQLENLEHHNGPDFGQQNMQDFGQQSVQDFGQQNEQDFGQQSVQDFGQQNVQDFGQQSVQDLGQRNVQDFGQQSMQDFGQQNVQDFGHQSVQDFGQQNEKDFGQQSVQNFGQQNVQDFGQQSVQDFGQQNEQDFGQQSVQDFGQRNVQDFGQQSMQDFGQQSVQDFGQQSTQDSGQQNMQDLGHLDERYRHQNRELNGNSEQQNESLDHQNLHNLEQLNKEPEQNPKYLDNKEQGTTGSKISTQQSNLPHLAVIAEPIQVQKQNNDLQSISQHSSVNNKEVSSVELVTDKPGFWKSIGSKFSKAKSKVASWFSS